MRFLQLFMEDNQVESMTLQERFPTGETSRLVVANALYHTCCISPLCANKCLRRVLLSSFHRWKHMGISH
jgi:hypothetical protein